MKNVPLLAPIQRLCLAIALLAVAATAIHSAEPAYQLKVVTDREDALYETGEEAQFLISVTKDGKPIKEGAVSYTVDDFITPASPASTFPKGSLTLSGETLAVTVTSKHPGFLRCQVSFTPPGGKTLPIGCRRPVSHR